MLTTPSYDDAPDAGRYTALMVLKQVKDEADAKRNSKRRKLARQWLTDGNERFKEICEEAGRNWEWALKQFREMYAPHRKRL